MKSDNISAKSPFLVIQGFETKDIVYDLNYVFHPLKIDKINIREYTIPKNQILYIDSYQYSLPPNKDEEIERMVSKGQLSQTTLAEGFIKCLTLSCIHLTDNIKFFTIKSQTELREMWENSE